MVCGPTSLATTPLKRSNTYGNFLLMKAVEVDQAHRIQLEALRPGDLYEPEINGPHAEEVRLRRLKTGRSKMTKAEALKAIEQSPLRFSHSWDELRHETREV